MLHFCGNLLRQHQDWSWLWEPQSLASTSFFYLPLSWHSPCVSPTPLLSPLRPRSTLQHPASWILHLFPRAIWRQLLTNHLSQNQFIFLVLVVWYLCNSSEKVEVTTMNSWKNLFKQYQSKANLLLLFQDGTIVGSDPTVTATCGQGSRWLMWEPRLYAMIKETALACW